tara:strand:- start:347 stop:1114 length:768 start_codon:yes stop_codon:yes gene_type:complete
MRIAIVTSFNKLLYEYYAHRFLHSYNWEFDLHIYHEGWTPSDFDIRDNIHYIDINSGKNGNQLRRFQNKVGYYNVASTVNGRPDKIIHGTDYKKDAIRFSYKVFAKTDFILKSHISNSYDYVFWIDADVIFKKPISKRDVIKKFLPKEYAISFIHRPTYYSECGFVGYNLTHDSTINFVRKFREQYTSLQLVKEKEWHDSFIFDCVRDKWLSGYPQFNLSPQIKKVGNPWPDTPMAEYMDHLKGKARKDAGEMLK